MSKEVVVKNLLHINTRLCSLKHEEEFCDATLLLNDKRINVHSVILASASDYFKTCFKKLEKKEVIFKNVNKEALNLLINYCYTGNIKITDKNAKEVLPLAKILSMRHILENSIDVFKNKIDIKERLSDWKYEKIGYVERLITDDNMEENTLIAVIEANQMVKKSSSKSDPKRKRNEKETQIHPMEIFNVVDEKWIQVDIHSNKSRFASSLLDDKLMLIGGKLNGKISNTIDCYNLKTGNTEIVPSMKYSRADAKAVQFKGSLYVIGGENEKVLQHVERYDPATNEWTDVMPLNIARTRFGASSLECKIFVVGGQDMNCEYLSSVEAYSLTKNKWTKYAPMKEKRYCPGVATVNGYLYAVGGYNTFTESSKTVERFDYSINKWTMIQPLNIGSFYYTAANLNGYLVVGGKGSLGTETTIETYDENNRQWKPMESIKYFGDHFNLVQLSWDLAKVVFGKTIK